jgi:hypothetical protein
MTWPLRMILVVGALGVGLGLALLESSLRPRPPLAVLGQIPPFHLVDERGLPFGVD